MLRGTGKSNSRGFFGSVKAVLSNSVWAGIGSFIATIGLIATVVFGLLTLPQAAPLRRQVARVLSGTPTSTQSLQPHRCQLQHRFRRGLLLRI